MQSFHVFWVAGLVGLLTSATLCSEGLAFGGSVKPADPAMSEEEVPPADTATAPAASEAKLIFATDTEEIFQMAAKWGSAGLQITGNADPKITGTINGSKYSIYFYGCGDSHDRCKSIEFLSSWRDTEATYERLNEWNKTKRWPGVARTDEDSVRMTIEVNLEGGISTANLDAWFDWWEISLRSFRAFLYD